MTIQKYEANCLPFYLTHQQMVNPFEYIEQFFNMEIDVIDARKWLTLLSRSALSENLLPSKREMVTLFGLREYTLMLIEAGYIIYKYHWENLPNVSIETNDGNFNLAPSMYCDPRIIKLMEWDFFPRHLSRKEFINPYKVLSKLFKSIPLNIWRKKIEELFAAAISEGGIYSCLDDKDPWMLCQSLFKLYEACHLIKIRLLLPQTSPEK